MTQAQRLKQLLEEFGVEHAHLTNSVVKDSNFISVPSGGKVAGMKHALVEFHFNDAGEFQGMGIFSTK